MTVTNVTGLVVAVIVFSGHRIKDFIKPIFVIWVVICLIILPISIHIVLLFIPYSGQVFTAAINVFVYGMLLIKISIDYFIEKRRTKVNKLYFILWALMMLLMGLSVNESIWPYWFLAMFGSFYLTNYNKETVKVIYCSLVDGLIFGFFAIQGTALIFRPYDIVRYSGLYINPNFNGLFYLMTYVAFLCKWLMIHKNGYHSGYRIVISLFAGAMYGFALLTGSKTTMIAMLLSTLPFILLMVRNKKMKVQSFIKHWMILFAAAVVSVPIVYFSVRYIPTIHLHPLYFEGEYNESKVQPGEPRESDKYITFEQAMEGSLGRIFYLLKKPVNSIESGLVLRVQAAELENEPEYIITDADSLGKIPPLRLRYEIYRFYIERLNLFGHTNDYEGAPVYRDYYAPHAHNVFIQMAFLYGIPAGLLFLLVCFTFFMGCKRLLNKGDDEKVCVIACFITAFLVFGFFEIDWMCGQLPFTLFFILFKDVVCMET